MHFAVAKIRSGHPIPSFVSKVFKLLHSACQPSSLVQPVNGIPRYWVQLAADFQSATTFCPLCGEEINLPVLFGLADVTYQIQRPNLGMVFPSGMKVALTLNRSMEIDYTSLLHLTRVLCPTPTAQ